MYVAAGVVHGIVNTGSVRAAAATALYACLVSKYACGTLLQGALLKGAPASWATILLAINNLSDFPADQLTAYACFGLLHEHAASMTDDSDYHTSFCKKAHGCRQGVKGVSFLRAVSPAMYATFVRLLQQAMQVMFVEQPLVCNAAN